MKQQPQPAIRERIWKIARDAGFDSVGVAFHDYETRRTFAENGGQLFHAASTIKAAILIALYKLAEQERIRLDDPLHVRNRFRSLVGGAVFRVAADRDGDAVVHGQIGRSMRLRDLARAMIVRSSNLATNLLLDLLGVATVQRVIAAAGVEGVRLVRGVEDSLAFEKGISNQASATGLVQLFRLLCEGRFLHKAAREQILEVLLAQEFNAMIPRGLPAQARVAHKTGEISTACHDAGVVFLPGRKPFVVAILTSARAKAPARTRAVAAISRAVFEALS